jgi:hypothetical protein
MKRVLFAIVLAALLIATTGAASAGTTRIYFTGVEKCDAPIFPQNWMAGPNWQARGIYSICHDRATIPQYTGTSYLSDGRLQWLVGQVNPILATDLRMETKEGGVWVGSGVFPANTDTVKIVMQGEGLYAGQEIRVFLSYENSTIWGYIEDTGN